MKFFFQVQVLYQDNAEIHFFVLFRVHRSVRPWPSFETRGTKNSYQKSGFDFGPPAKVISSFSHVLWAIVYENPKKTLASS